VVKNGYVSLTWKRENSMSCFGGSEDNEPAVGECPDCGEPVDKDGDAVKSCSYSPLECETCGWRPCDQSC